MPASSPPDQLFFVIGQFEIMPQRARTSFLFVSQAFMYFLPIPTATAF